MAGPRNAVVSEAIRSRTRLLTLQYPGVDEETARILAKMDAEQAMVSAMCRDAIREIDDRQAARREREADEARNPTNPLAWLARRLFG